MIACGGSSLSVSDGEKKRFVWWQFWNLSFKNSLSSVSVRDGCTFLGYLENNFTGGPLVIRKFTIIV